MKRLLKVLSFLPVLLVLGSCEFVLGPDTPAGEGNLSVSVGANGRAISSGADLPAEVLSGMVYKLKLSGPNDEVIEAEVAGEGTLNVTVTPGQWRIDARAYQEDVLAGTGHVSFTVSSGFNSVQVPMMINGGYFNITPSPMSGGAVTASFDAAFPDTTITLTPLPDEGYALGTLKYNDGTDHVISGPPYTFTMPESDVTVSAEFVNLIRYVTETGSGDGLSWANASGDLQAMMDELAELYDSGLYPGPFVVKAAAGTYRPQYKPTNIVSANGTPQRTTTPSTTDRDSAFILRKGVQVWGGYPASGGDDSSRDITANVTTLSGDIGTPNDTSDNAYHVALGVDIPAGSGTVLDGFTITGGHSKDVNGDIPVAGKTITRGDGAGLYNYNSSPVLVDVIISDNYANWGGGLYNMSSSPALINVIISGNIAGYGGGMVNNSSSPALVNVVISGNSTDYGDGGGTVDNASSPALINVTISGNSALVYGGGMNNHDNSSSPVIRNSVIWGNTAGWSGSGIHGSNPGTVISHSIVQDSGDTANGNKADPGTGAANSPFADWQDPGSVSMPNSEGDYGLAAGSPAINAGDNALYPDTWEKWQFLIGTTGAITTKAEYDAYIAPHLGKDLAGNTRKNGAIDMGACEKQ